MLLCVYSNVYKVLTTWLHDKDKDSLLLGRPGTKRQKYHAAAYALVCNIPVQRVFET